MFSISLSGKVALVTGAGRGIGAAIAATLAEAGATMALHAFRHTAAAEALAARCGNGAAVFRAGLSDPAAAPALAREVLAHYGRVDILINNAGVAIPAPLDMDDAAWTAAWQETQQVNLLAAAQLCKVLIPEMAARGGGRIVHIASRAAFRGDTPDFLAYAASKGGMVALSRSIARGYGKDNICSFVVAPGFTRSDMAQQFIEEYGEDIVKKDLALPRITLPEDIAPAVLFLASGLMDHATGCTIDLNAGSYVH